MILAKTHNIDLLDQLTHILGIKTLCESTHQNTLRKKTQRLHQDNSDYMKTPKFCNTPNTLKTSRQLRLLTIKRTILRFTRTIKTSTLKPSTLPELSCDFHQDNFQNRRIPTTQRSLSKLTYLETHAFSKLRIFHFEYAPHFETFPVQRSHPRNIPIPQYI